MKVHLLLSVASALLAAAGNADAQSQTKSSSTRSNTDSEPCCAITSIDVAKSLVTARSKAGQIIQFEVKDATLMKSLRVSQGIWMHPSGKVAIKYADPCCNVIGPAEGAAKADVTPVEPCCNITALNLATGIVTAREGATGRTFRFEVKDAALLKSLKVGQAVFADFGSSKVRIHGVEPCCGIIGHGNGRFDQ
jgi:hypothetical protein